MKSYLFKLSLSLLLLLVASFSFSQTDVVRFEKSTLKFGKVNEGELVKLTYYFRNNGKFSMSIIPPQVDCSCTTVILPENDIAGGARDSIQIHFDTAEKIGYQEREVILQFVSNFADSQSIDKKVVFKGMVKASQETKDKYKQSKNK